ncbi:EamA family transporter [Segniliparus rugosus]|uniref:EamA domain-containing protein n=1 Tax=Segniliparus rugosus (strain ATCC BAA-974 / DSM 45345 / CCUG 50838 / CIP 108380 / JCM 13579 / CDC 945) TaxID=679197 RepID=E5XT08_SEGRC|nr:EamA family transporter [Segniliparus rugosus]EFV12518.1 hypothetical protein HMPREF9336_02630 [Segniliparus rugosus ATCC BAA-974]
MNIFFYLAISILPLGSAVAIEFLGPTAVAAFYARSLKGALAALLALAGVLLVSGARFSQEVAGVVFALLAAFFWAGYIFFGKAVSNDRDISSLAVAFAAGALITSPALAFGVGHEAAWGHIGEILFFGLGLGLLSNVIPYSADQFIFRRVGEAYFALLLAMLPVAAALIGFFVLGQKLSFEECVGVLCVVAAIALGKPS